MVLLLYVALTALVSIPMTIITRRVHASMLSDEDLAIVPFHRGTNADIRRGHNDYDNRGKFRKPGLTFSQAWATITWSQYASVLKMYAQYWIVNQGVQVAYWGLNWKLHGWLGVERYARTKLPWSPVGVVKALGGRKFPEMGDEGVGKTEL